MAWYNPWGEIRRLKEERSELLKLFKEEHDRHREHLRLTDAARKEALVQLEAAQANNLKLAEENTKLHAKLKHAHFRDPKTGRITKAGALDVG